MSQIDLQGPLTVEAVLVRAGEVDKNGFVFTADALRGMADQIRAECGNVVTVRDRDGRTELVLVGELAGEAEQADGDAVRVTMRLREPR